MSCDACQPSLIHICQKGNQCNHPHCFAISQVEWSVVDSDANMTGTYQITSDSTGSSLVIDSAAVKDGQQFICRVTNSHGHAASTVTVHHEGELVRHGQTV